MSDSLKLEEISLEEDRERFEAASQKLLGLSAEEFELRMESRDFSDLDQSAAMRVAMLRPS